MNENRLLDLTKMQPTLVKFVGAINLLPVVHPTTSLLTSPSYSPLMHCLPQSREFGWHPQLPHTAEV